MTIFDKEIPSFQFSKSNTTKLVLFTASFALLFLNLYSPFGFKSSFWESVTDFQLFLYSSIATLTGMLVVVLSRIIMFYYSKKFVIKYRNYSVWILFEIIAMAFFYTLLQVFVLHDERTFFNLFKLSIRNTALVLLLPYSVSWLYFSWVDKNNKIEYLLNSQNSSSTSSINFIHDMNKSSAMLPIKDSSGVMRISVKAQDLLYFEAADNYVKVCYLKGQKINKTLIRNTLKNIETDLNDKNFIRCHRSFVINFEKVKVIEKGKNGLQILLDHQDEIIIPVSKTYFESVMKYFADSSLPEEV
ncbi:MAG: LytTR family transcriptional regulator [Bacteroidales bacterium]|nr:LytTR family transcriptional regulator [Bacteroidales bacterium]